VAVRSQHGRHVHLPEHNMRMRRTSRVTHICVTWKWRDIFRRRRTSRVTQLRVITSK